MSSPSSRRSTARHCESCGHDNPAYFLACHACWAPLEFRSKALVLGCARAFLLLWTALSAVVLIGGAIVIFVSGVIGDRDENPAIFLGFLVGWIVFGAVFVAIGRSGLRRLEAVGKVRGEEGETAEGPVLPLVRPNPSRGGRGNAFCLRAESSLPQFRSSRGPGMLVFALVWNVIVATVFGGIVATGESVEVMVWIIGSVFAAIGVLLAVLAVRNLLLRWRFREAIISVPKEVFHPGDAVTVHVEQTFRGHLDPQDVRLRLLLRESAVYRQGTTMTTRTEDHILETVSLKESHHWGGNTFESATEFRLPEGAMHTMLTPYNRLQYLLELTVIVPRWPDYVECFELPVLPRAPAEI